MSEPLELRAELERTPLGAVHVFTIVTLSCALLFDGYNVFAPAYVIPSAAKAWLLSPSESGLLVSSGLVGFMIGSLANGPIADRLGRKPTLLGALLVAALMNFATAAWGDSYARFLGLRLATGVGLGMILPISVTLVNELVPRRHVNTVMGWVMTGWSLGGVAAALAANALVSSRGWPALFAVGALAAPLIGVAALALPESPQLLLARRRPKEARAVMARLAPARAQAYATAELVLREPTGHAGSFARLLSGGYRRGTLVVWACTGLSLFAIFGLSSWIPDILLRRGAGMGASFKLSAVLQFAGVLGGIGCGWAADRAGRERALSVIWLTGAAALAGLALLNVAASNLTFMVLAGFCVIGAQPVLNNRTAALYETAIRGTGVGAQLGVGRLGGILGPYLGGWLQQLFPGSSALLLCLAATMLCCALCLQLLSSGPALTSYPAR